MANTKSAQKANRSSLRKRQFNLTTKTKVKNSIKTFRKAVVSDITLSNTSLSAVFSALDKAVKTNYIPKRRASRKKSRLAKMLAKTAVAQTTTANK
jgi:small subunit ribosomal protein S20